MAGWHHRLEGPEFEQAPGVGEGQGGLVCCSPCSGRESDTTERLNNNNRGASTFEAWLACVCACMWTCVPTVNMRETQKKSICVSFLPHHTGIPPSQPAPLPWLLKIQLLTYSLGLSHPPWDPTGPSEDPFWAPCKHHQPSCLPPPPSIHRVRLDGPPGFSPSSRYHPKTII